jgi:hypothetical protein
MLGVGDGRAILHHPARAGPGDKLKPRTHGTGPGGRRRPTERCISDMGSRPAMRRIAAKRRYLRRRLQPAELRSHGRATSCQQGLCPMRAQILVGHGIRAGQKPHIGGLENR